jgi:Fe-Mn family superoxide dismutase
MSRVLVPAATLFKKFSTATSSATGFVHKLPTLPYGYGELEPAITGQIMETHHTKHHQTYVTNLNNFLAQYAEAEKANDVAKQISLQPAIRFHGGGHVNHSIFWTNLAPASKGGGGEPTGDLAKQIERDFGNFESLKTQLSTASVGVQGSGWGWLGWNKTAKRIEITTRANQDPLVELVPLLGIDVWEHAYYYKYGPARAEYIKNIWSIINWKNVAERLEGARK